LGSSLFWISYVAAWTLIAILFTAVYLLYRHFGEQLVTREKRRENSGGPKLHEVANFNLKGISNKDYRLGPDADCSHLIFFAAPNCRYCAEVKPIIGSLAAAHTNVRLIIIYLGSTESASEYAQDMQQAAFVVADPTKEFAQLWNIPGTPYLVFVNRKGLITKKGIAGGGKEKIQVFFSGDSEDQKSTKAAKGIVQRA